MIKVCKWKRTVFY
uniref:Uncharacterized protein n=1 Tax=Anguilla anguilla TaxID=7936 RepID=A0A0E9UGM3_ANGAN